MFSLQDWRISQIAISKISFYKVKLATILLLFINHNDLPKQRDRMVDTLNSFANADSLLQD